jgi:tRNA (guanine37-N1)-methyltransferase
MTSLRVDVVSIFPRMVEACTTDGIVQRAVDKGLVKIVAHDLRAFTDDRHRTVDDAPFGGGPGMVMKVEPFLRAVDVLKDPAIPEERRAVVLFTPRGRRFDQKQAERLAKMEQIVMLCGRYEGIDERVVTALQPEEISLGDFVLTGGEVAAVAVIEAAVRLIPGALGDDQSAVQDSFAADGLLDYPHYTRPAVVRGHEVPAVLLSGDHEKVRRFRRRESLRLTRERRPDLLAAAQLTPEDGGLLREIEDEDNGRARQAGVAVDYEVKVS